MNVDRGNAGWIEDHGGAFRLGWEAEFMGRGRDRWPKSAGVRVEWQIRRDGIDETTTRSRMCRLSDMAMSRRCFRWEAVFMRDVVEFDDGRVLTIDD